MPKTQRKPGTRWMPPAYFRGNQYARRIEDADDGRRIIVTKLNGSNPHATCSQVAVRSIPRGWRRSSSRPIQYVGPIKGQGHGAAIFEYNGHAISVPIERKHA